ncbi:TIGR01777 family oxidoreductase [Flavobacterium sp. MFBS3-15]|uniref:TIGR01777 family oxidoreductase n=1 Tax=Flavobacterium sp. MFBS3-15 TaxID=2989816 RepID=UPI00223624BE|nr:TIGR01777 family oxidoreductase [Flavobacterium sp. MFBS3-15]MCW4470682.1 TIGR01777 family oxidoreductase [Flavobacterium sp. MFBS3-15]
MKKMIIAAGTGFLGNVLIDHFKNDYKIVVLTRGKAEIKNDIRYVNWDAKTMTGWEAELEGADVLINLAGKSVDCRYNEKNKSEIMASRVDSTVILDKAVSQCANPPKHWLNSSTATIYRNSVDKQMDEETGEIGHDFSMNVAKVWEKAFFRNETPGTLKTALRTSIVLGRNGGAFVPLKKLAQFGLGGRQGSGRQFVSWIHEKDFARAVEFIIERRMEGPINVVSPTPVRNAAFMKTLRKAVGMPVGIPIGTSLLKLGAMLIGTETELVLKSRNVIPKRLTDAGFTFGYGDLGTALGNLLNKY